MAYAFYKNLAYCLPNILFAAVSGFSAQPLYTSSLIATFNVVWTSWPTIGFAVLEQVQTAVFPRSAHNWSLPAARWGKLCCPSVGAERFLPLQHTQHVSCLHSKAVNKHPGPTLNILSYSLQKPLTCIQISHEGMQTNMSQDVCMSLCMCACICMTTQPVSLPRQ